MCGGIFDGLEVVLLTILDVLNVLAGVRDAASR